MRIAMWSGPRNLSTAMMYAFAARGDCAVWDEPFYAAYLAKTGQDHPLADEIIAAHEDDPQVVADRCLGSIPGEKPHFYMKHMPHHMVDGVPVDWARLVTNVFLIRHPARVIASYAAKRENPTLEDIGFSQQAALFETMRGWGQEPVVVDSFDIRMNPEQSLRKLCDAIGLPFTLSMLKWEPGPRPYDGVWARHWYGAVWRSTGFAEPEGDLPEIPANLQPVLDAAMPFYEVMRAKAI